MGKLAQKTFSSAKKILDRTGISGCDYCEYHLKAIRACAGNKHIFKGVIPDYSAVVDESDSKLLTEKEYVELMKKKGFHFADVTE